MKKIVIVQTAAIDFDQRMQRTITTLSDFFNIQLLCRGKGSFYFNYDTKVEYLGLTRTKGFLFYAIFNLKALIKLLTIESNAILAVDLDTLPAAFLASRIKNTPLYYDAHEYFVEVPELTNRPFHKWFWGKLAHFLIPKAKVCYTVNYPLAQILSKTYNKKFEVVHNMPFFSHITAVKPQNSIAIYQGALNKGRGLEELLLVFKSLTTITFWICGSGDKEAFIKQYIKSNDIKNIELKGNLEPNALKDLTRKATFGLNLLTSDNLNYYYSLANKWFDYIQADLPQITMDFPVYQAFNSKHQVAILISDLKKESITAAIEEILTPKKYELLKSNCELAAKDWNWEIESKQLIQIFSNEID